MNYSFDDILFKDFCSNPFIRQWIFENRYVSDGVFKFFLWMFIFAAFFYLQFFHHELGSIYYFEVFNKIK